MEKRESTEHTNTNIAVITGKLSNEITKLHDNTRAMIGENNNDDIDITKEDEEEKKEEKDEKEKEKGWW